MVRIAAIGLGSRAAAVIAALVRYDSSVQVVAAADPAPEAVRGNLRRESISDANLKFFKHADALLESADEFDGIVIGTRCDLHTEMAIKVAAKGRPLFLEKPVGISSAQL